jgi:Cu/Zn superoxide dismutase
MNLHTTVVIAAVAAPVLSAGLASAAQACAAEVFRGHLVDLSTAAPDPFGDASAKLVMTSHGDGTRFHLRIRGIDSQAAGRDFGAHLHVGPCVAGDGAAAGPHYNASTATPPVVSDETEVWLDFTVTRRGTGSARTTVPFRPTPGARSVVVHAEPTSPTGTAGARLVCLPVVWS